jgi:hypothetical protein
MVLEFWVKTPFYYYILAISYLQIQGWVLSHVWSTWFRNDLQIIQKMEEE